MSAIISENTWPEPVAARRSAQCRSLSIPGGVVCLDPLRVPAWDEELGRHEAPSFFLTSGWARVLKDAYGYRPLYFVIPARTGMRSILAVMEVRSFLTGKRGVSLPFSDLCPPLLGGDDDFQVLYGTLEQHARVQGWRYVELRGASSLCGSPAFRRFYHHELELNAGVEGLFGRFRSSTRRNIRKAQRLGIKVGRYTTLEALRVFYRLHCRTRKNHGVPPQPWRFFRKMQEHILERGKGFVVLAHADGRPVAAAVFFHFGRQAVYKFGASDRRYQHLRANNLVMWEAIRGYAEQGFKTLSFGRTALDNQGLLQFKRGWGGTESLISYHRYDMKLGQFVEAASGQWAVESFLRRCPAACLRLAGELLYRHMG